METEERKSKSHRQSRAGRKHDKKKTKAKFTFEDEVDNSKEQETAKKRNPKVHLAFTSFAAV